MAYLRQVLHLIHLTCFAFMLGNIINDYFFGKRKYDKSQYPLLGRIYTYSWLGMIITGIWQVMVISLQHKYVKNSKYATWVKLYIFKILFTLLSAYGLEIITKIFIPAQYRRRVLAYLRISCFILLFLLSSYIREYRETELKKKDKTNEEKKNA